MANRTKTRHRFVGTIADWSMNEFPEIRYPEPSGDAKCAEDGNCNIDPGYTSEYLRVAYV
jgi:hypothetical protein